MLASKSKRLRWITVSLLWDPPSSHLGTHPVRAELDIFLTVSLISRSGSLPEATVTPAPRLPCWWVSYETKGRWGSASQKGKQHSHGDSNGQLYKLRKQILVCPQEVGLLCDTMHKVRPGEVRETIAVNFRKENAPHRCSPLCNNMQPQVWFVTIYPTLFLWLSQASGRQQAAVRLQVLIMGQVG